MTKIAINPQFEKWFNEKHPVQPKPEDYDAWLKDKQDKQEAFEDGFFLGRQKGWTEGVEYGKVPF